VLISQCDTISGTIDMKTVAGEIARLRSEVKSLGRKPFGHKPMVKLLKDVIASLKAYLPKAEIRKSNNKWVCNFGIKDLPLVMVERVHRGRDAISQFWRSKQLNTVVELLDLVESQVKEDV